jgi:hypothetical protein
MEEQKITIPKTLDECFDTLDKILQDKDVFKATPEKQMSAQAHMFLGRWLRNNWHLWWSEELYSHVKDKSPEYPSTKPELVKWFNEQGIHHADDMSGIIVLSYHRKLNDKPIDLEAQVKRTIEFYADKLNEL